MAGEVQISFPLKVETVVLSVVIQTRVGGQYQSPVTLTYASPVPAENALETAPPHEQLALPAPAQLALPAPAQPEASPASDAAKDEKWEPAYPNPSDGRKMIYPDSFIRAVNRDFRDGVSRKHLKSRYHLCDAKLKFCLSKGEAEIKDLTVWDTTAVINGKRVPMLPSRVNLKARGSRNRLLDGEKPWLRNCVVCGLYSYPQICKAFRISHATIRWNCLDLANQHRKNMEEIDSIPDENQQVAALPVKLYALPESLVKS
jgi:hypothetical protein